MKLAVCTIATLALTLNAAAFECPFGEEGPLKPIRWSAEASPIGTYVRVGVQNTFDKPIRMVDAGVWFIDPLDRIVSGEGLEIDPDLKIPASAGNIAGMTVTGFDRLVGAKQEDFTPRICVRAVLFDDGSKVSF